MKKLLLTIFVFMLMMGTASHALSTTSNKTLSVQTAAEPVRANFTHTVFAEETTATWCSNCPFVAEAIYNVYQSGDYDFFYVALVDDMNPIAKARNIDYTFISKVYAFPTVYFDGGDTNVVGRSSTVPLTEAEYRPLIEQEGERTPRQPLTLDTSATWDGNAQITITITATNEGSLPYFGKIRSYVTEIESRWIDDSGDPYHFALLDYALNRYVLLLPNKAKSFTETFDGAADHQGQTYEDITQENIQIVTTISHWIPHFRTGYESDTYNQYYLAYYVDQTDATTPL